ncbi:efflux RND transporter periplasmic adaptor subunit [Sediminibacterium soli]|uniref:efflux RND transporter periplasmic adaptor subunit n=1 Tax=Sediminibacterium soli TaxID=2698829 RepID=UPI0013799690|nr:efflux RND transporter periplasmic adaptor subunit [Sediminibacterium soli]NCI47417.1 efflux RND transporter periplasmic adaptor subunit [Sediminibacterium soli]
MIQTHSIISENTRRPKHGFFNTLLGLLSAMVLLGLVSCGQSKTKTTAETETKADTAQQEENIAEVTAGQMKAVGIELVMMERQNLSSVVKASGQLTVPPQNRAVVNALVGGVIKRIQVIEGQQVRSGQTVVVIENPDFIRLQQDYLTSKDNIVYLAQEYERQRVLQEADAGIGKVYQQASANYAAEQSRIQTLEAQLRQIHINPAQIRRANLVTQVPVLAPISGTVGRIHLGVGTYTDASNPIMEIVNNSVIFCDLQVFEKDMAKVQTGQTVNFILTNQNDKRVSGRVYGINKTLDTGTRAATVHARVDNIAPLHLIAGQYVTALIETGKQLVQAVPRDAIVKANDKTYIFVLEGMEKEPVKKDAGDKETDAKAVQEKYRFAMTEVVTGVEELGYVEVRLLAPLKPGTKIVSKGAFYLYASMQNTETDDL